MWANDCQRGCQATNFYLNRHLFVSQSFRQTKGTRWLSTVMSCSQILVLSWHLEIGLPVQIIPIVSLSQSADGKNLSRYFEMLFLEKPASTDLLMFIK